MAAVLDIEMFEAARARRQVNAVKVRASRVCHGHRRLGSKTPNVITRRYGAASRSLACARVHLSATLSYSGGCRAYTSTAGIPNGFGSVLALGGIRG